MVKLSKAIREVSIFEPMLMDLLEPEINEQHARIIAMLFKLGGYTTLNNLTKALPFAQPTVSIRVTELEKMGYLRKNSELLPIVIVLLLNVEDLERQLNKKIEKQRHAVEFLKEFSYFHNKQLLRDTFFRAINVVFKKEEILADLIIHTYLNVIISREELINLLVDDLGNSTKIKAEFDSLLSSKKDIFYVIYQKQKKAETYIRSLLPLNLLIENRSKFLESLYTHYNELLGDLTLFVSSEYDPIDPHQFLQYPSEIGQRINTCLKNYLSIKIIDNSVYGNSSGDNGILKLITSSDHYSSDHRVQISYNEKIQTPTSLSSSSSSQIEFSTHTNDIGRDYSTRDFIIFDNHGCIVFPAKKKGSPYYIISPRFIKTILSIFKSNWR